jgi:primosomal protein N' (replication factor Y)
MHAIARCLEAGQGALILVPEIALTPQLVGRFRARLGNAVAVLHSGLADRARHEMWRKLRSAELRVAVGARSALFAPVPDLGLIVVDEEHDGSFKQEEGVRYHARDMAILRAHRAGAAVVLGSATPSLESVALVKRGRLEQIRLPERATRASMPDVEIVDLKRHGSGPSGNRLLTGPLHRGIEAALDAGEQAIIFLNRRGFAPAVVCDGCGIVATCKACAVALTYHRRFGRLRCHYCDFQTELHDRCPECGRGSLVLEGLGTEKLESALAESFPKARVARLDRDVAAGAKSAKILDRMRRGEIDVLVGTQMVTKGHDLPSVTMVGVVNADAALSMPDFRAAERGFQLLVQVAGRAGRHERRGRVLIQTRNPDHPAVSFAATQNVEGFLERELVDRREAGYPPFSRLALVRVDALDEDAARRAAARIAAHARTTPAAAKRALEVLGPAPAPIPRLRSRYRFRVMLRARTRPPLRTVVAGLLQKASAIDRKVRVVFDMDPVSML